MVVNKRSKTSRARGSWTHGWGAKKKHRGAGHRGGRGTAGSGKRADAKKPRIWAKKNYFGKHGFKYKGTKVDIKTITLTDLQDRLDSLVEKKLVAQEGDSFVIDLEKLGFNKLLGTGKVTKKLKISVPFVSAKAAEKVKSAGGKLKSQESAAEQPE